MFISSTCLSYLHVYLIYMIISSTWVTYLHVYPRLFLKSFWQTLTHVLCLSGLTDSHCRGKCNLYSPRSTSTAIPADHMDDPLTASPACHMQLTIELIKLALPKLDLLYFEYRSAVRHLVSCSILLTCPGFKPITPKLPLYF